MLNTKVPYASGRNVIGNKKSLFLHRLPTHNREKDKRMVNPFHFSHILWSFLTKEELTSETRDYVESELERNAGLAKLVEELNDTEKISEQLSIIYSFDKEKALRKIRGNIPARRRFSWMGRVASVIVIAILSSLSVLFWIKDRNTYQTETIGTGKVLFTSASGEVFSLDTLSTIRTSNALELQNEEEVLVINENSSVLKEETRWNVIEVPKKSTYKVILQDGTEVNLNSGSSLEFPSRFVDDSREVRLRGEAFFHVAKQEGKPFVVTAGEVRVRVLGTLFNLKSYEEEMEVKATLLQGSVAFEAGGDAVVVQPGEQAIFDKAAKQTNLHKVNTEPFVAWTHHLFYFDRTSLEDIMRSISRWYDVDIIYEGIGLDDVNTLYTGKVKMYDHPQDILRKLEITGELKFELTKSTIYVRKK